MAAPRLIVIAAKPRYPARRVKRNSAASVRRFIKNAQARAGSIQVPLSTLNTAVVGTRTGTRDYIVALKTRLAAREKAKRLAARQKAKKKTKKRKKKKTSSRRTATSRRRRKCPRKRTSCKRIRSAARRVRKGKTKRSRSAAAFILGCSRTRKPKCRKKRRRTRRR